MGLREYRGHHLVDVRVYYDAGSEMRPTKKGVCFNVALLPEVVAALEKMRRPADDDDDSLAF